MENLQKKSASDRNYRSGERKKQFGKQRQGIGNRRLSVQKMRITHVVYSFLPLLRRSMQVGVRDLDALMTGEIARHCCATPGIMFDVRKEGVTEDVYAGFQSQLFFLVCQRFPEGIRRHAIAFL